MVAVVPAAETPLAAPKKRSLNMQLFKQIPQDQTATLFLPAFEQAVQRASSKPVPLKVDHAPLDQPTSPNAEHSPSGPPVPPTPLLAPLEPSVPFKAIRPQSVLSDASDDAPAFDFDFETVGHGSAAPERSRAPQLVS